MKKILSILFFVSLLFTACEEEGPLIILEEPIGLVLDTTFVTTNIPVAQPKGVLMEEFSGVRCSNCPEGNLATHTLVGNYGERLVAIAAHSDFLAAPYDGDQDLRTDDANTLANTLGPINGKPATFIDRKVFSGNTTREIINPATWDGFVQQQLSLTTPVNLEIEKLDYNESSRVLTFSVRATYISASNSHNLGIALTESEIIAEQLDGSTKVEDYEHEYVLRDYISPIIGNPLTAELSPGRVFVQEYGIELDPLWVQEHMEIVAFIRGANDEIVHAVKLALN